MSNWGVVRIFGSSRRSRMRVVQRVVQPRVPATDGCAIESRIPSPYLQLYHQQATGSNYYGEGFDLFDEGGLFEGLETLRAPLLASPQEEPPREESCESDEVWALLMRCVRADPTERPTMAELARSMGELRQAADGIGSTAGWL